MRHGTEFAEEFQRQGFVEGIRVRDCGAADLVRAQWDELEPEEDVQAAGYSTMHSRHLDRRFVWNLATDPAILDHVEQQIGPDILLFGTRFFCKYGPTPLRAMPCAPAHRSRQCHTVGRDPGPGARPVSEFRQPPSALRLSW